MTQSSDRKTVAVLDPVVAFLIVAGLAGILVHGLVTGWVWIPGSRHGSGAGYWANRHDNLRDYVVYLVIMAGATLTFLGVFVSRLNAFNAAEKAKRDIGAP